MDEPVQKVVRAEAFELVDASGRTRATLAAEENGACWLTFAGRDGGRRAFFGVSGDDSASIGLLDEQERERAGMLVTKRGPELSLCGPEGSAEVKVAIPGNLHGDMVVFTCTGAEGGSRVRTVVTPIGHAAVEAAAGDEQPAARVAAAPDGALELGAIAPGRKPWAGLQMTADGTPGLTMRDRPGEVRIRLLLDPQGAPQLTLTDATGADRIALLFGEAERPRLYFVDGQRQIRVAFVMDSAGDPGLDLIAEDGKRTVRFGFLGTGHLLMALLGNDAEARVEITATGTDADSSIAFGAQGGSPRLLMGVDAQGYSEAVMMDGKERRRLGIRLQSNSMPCLELFDGVAKQCRAVLGLLDNGEPFAFVTDRRGWKTVIKGP